jgi:hypothetical protein
VITLFVVVIIFIFVDVVVITQSSQIRRFNVVVVVVVKRVVKVPRFQHLEHSNGDLLSFVVMTPTLI